MLNKKKLSVAIILLGILFLLLSGCVKDSQNQKEIPITTSSDEALQLFLKGRDMLDKLKTPQAAVLFDKAIAQDNNFAIAYLYRANSGGGYKIYREHLAKALELLDNVTEGEKHLILYNNADNSKDQRIEIDTLLFLYPEDKRVQELAGHFYYNLSDYTNALSHYKKSLEIDSSFAQIYNSLGYTYNGMENYPAAEESFKKYLELIPDEANPYDSYAEFLLMQGRYDQSIEQYDKAIKIDPEFVTALIGIGNNYVFKKDYNKAMDFYQQFYNKSSNINQKLAALWWTAVSYIHEGNINNAIKVLNERSVLAFANNYPTAGITSCRFSGWILADKSNLSEAEKYINKASDFIKTSKLSDGDRKAFEIIIDLDRCYIQILKKDFKGAEENLDALKQIVDMRLESTEIELLNFITGFLQLHKGNNDLALQYFQKIGEGNPYYWYWEASALAKADKTQEAKKLYAKISSYNTNSLLLALVRDRAKNKM